MNYLKKYYKIITFALIIVAILILNRHYGWSDYIGDIKNFDYLQDMVKENFLEAAIIYSVLTIIGCVVLALPGITFAVFAGLIFGPWLGTLLCLIATTIGAIAAYIAGKFFLKDTIKPLVMKNKWLKKVLFDDAGRSDIVVLMITRLVPLFPYNLQNFAYGITDISLGAYSLYTFLFMIPGVALFTIGSAGIVDSGNRVLYIGIAVALFVVVMFLGWFIKNKFLGNEDIDNTVKNREED